MNTITFDRFVGVTPPPMPLLAWAFTAFAGTMLSYEVQLYFDPHTRRWSAIREKSIRSSNYDPTAGWVKTSSERWNDHHGLIALLPEEERARAVAASIEVSR